MLDWINKAVFYHIYPLGFCGAPQTNREQNEPENRIAEVEKWIPHLLEIGVNAVYFGPVFESTSHGYDTMDYYEMDKRLGTNEDFKRVCHKLHEAGIKIVLDGVFNHVGRDFWAFKDIQQKGRDSKYVSWFANISFEGNSNYNDGFWYEGWEGCYDLVKLNLRNKEVVEHLLGAVQKWIETFDIDGIRLDVAYCLDQDFLKTLRHFCDEKKKDFWLMGEIIHGDYNRLLGNDKLHSTTNYECYKGIYSSHNDKNYFEINYSLERLFGKGGLYKDYKLYNFVDNHDVTRIASRLNEKKNLKNVYTILFMMPGIPSIYYGSEWGVEAKKEEGDAMLRQHYTLEDLKDKNPELIKHIAKLSELKTTSKALQLAGYQQVLVRNKQLVFLREWEGERVYIVLNLDDVQEKLSFKVQSDNDLEDRLNDHKKYSVLNHEISLSVPPFASLVLFEV